MFSIMSITSCTIILLVSMKTISKVTTKFPASNFIEGSFGLFIFVNMKLWRKLLWPFVPFYYLGSLFIKKMYDWGIFKSTTYNFPLITVGNISTGGTGKSPFVIYLVNLLHTQKKTAVLSRGYGRKTKEFSFVKEDSHAVQVGDEPLQLKKKFPEITVAVDGDRRNGIEQLTKQPVKPELIILDDAFQHRKVKANFQILLTAHYNLYVNDYSLPAGNLREPISAAARANVIIVTKCPKDIPIETQNKIINKLKPLKHQTVYFTSINYNNFVYGYDTKIDLKTFLKNTFCLVTGIAEPKPLLVFLNTHGANYTHNNYPDHHVFSDTEIIAIAKNETILTTEKDFMRLQYEPNLKGKLFYLPIGISFINNELKFKEQFFEATI